MRRRSCSQILNKATEKTGEEKRQWSYKVVVLGDSGTGKTWLIDRLMMRQKQRAYTSYYSDSPAEANKATQSEGTIGVTVNIRKVRLIDSQGAETGCSGGTRRTSTVLLHLWDTSGKPRYRNLIRNYIQDAHCIILVYNPAEGSEAAQRALASWYGFVKEAKNQVSVGDTIDSLMKGSKKQDLTALPIIVAISSGTCAYSLSEAATAGINFGRVFASSVCGRFYFVQRPSSCLLPHRCQHHHDDCIQQLIRHRLTSQLLAEVLVHYQRSRQHRRKRQLDKLDKLPSRQQSLLLLCGPADQAEDDASFSSAAETADDGCFWCRRIFGCRRQRKAIEKT